MSYVGHFRDIDDVLYTVEVITSVPESTEVTLSESPFVTSMEPSKDHIYKPARYSGATVSILSNNYLPDIYSPRPHGTRVRLLRGSEVVWVGFATPCLYTMGYARPLEVVEVECIDGLSTLQYLKYSTAEKSIVAFRHIIDKCLAACTVYTDYYVAATLRLQESIEIPVIDQLMVSEGLFFDEKDTDETDEDVAWTMQDVLEQIAQYLGLTMFAQGTSVYFVDYDAIKNGVNDYYHYLIGSEASPTLETISVPVAVTGSSHSRTGASLSMGDVYNKITVQDSLYSFNNAMPGFFDDITNITGDYDPIQETDWRSFPMKKDSGYGEIIEWPGDEVNKRMEAFVWSWGVDCALAAVFMKYYNSAGFRLHKYRYLNGRMTDVTDDVRSFVLSDSFNTHGSLVIKCGSEDLPHSLLWIESEQREGETPIDTIMRVLGASYADLSSYVFLCNPPDHHISNEDTYNYPFIETEAAEMPALFGGENAYLVISGSYNFLSFERSAFPISLDNWDLENGRYAMWQEDCYLPCRLQWGNYYWNGNAWTQAVSNFKLFYFPEESTRKERRADATMGKDIAYVNTVTWRLGADEKGYLIPMPTDLILMGKPHLTIFKPIDPRYVSEKTGDNKGEYYKHYYVFLKNFEMKAVICNPAISGEEETDTEYTNVIDASNVSTLSPIQFRICTWDNKEPNYSCVAYKDNQGRMTFLDKTFNPALSAGEEAWEGSDDDAPSAVYGLRQEEHFVYRLWNQYQSPAVKMQCHLRVGNSLLGRYTFASHPGKVFIADTISTDYRMKEETLNVVEKK